MTSLAFSNQNLMDALLGFSAFHLRSVNPLDREVSLASHKYMVRALRGHSDELRKGVDEKNAETLFATSTFITFHSCLSTRDLDSPRGPPLHWFISYRGIRAVLEAGWEWVKHSAIQSLLTKEVAFVQTIFGPDERLDSSPFDFLLEGLEKESQDIETVECYRSSVALLNWIQVSGQIRPILRFPAMMPPRFIRLLSEEDPRILAIVGYFFMLLKRVGGIWWMDDTVDFEFWSLMKLLPENWWPLMDWAADTFRRESLK